MKSSAKLSAAKWMLTLSLLLFVSCKKNEAKQDLDNTKQTKSFSADVSIQWLNMQLNMLRVPLATGVASEAADRCLAYCGIALYESVVPGMPDYKSLAGQLNQLPNMPTIQPGVVYHWAASANAALADMNRRLFPNASGANKNINRQFGKCPAGKVCDRC